MAEPYPPRLSRSTSSDWAGEGGGDCAAISRCSDFWDPQPPSSHGSASTAQLLEVLKPADLVANVCLRLSIQAAQRAPQQLAKGHLIAYHDAVVGQALRTVRAIEEQKVANVVCEEGPSLLGGEG